MDNSGQLTFSDDPILNAINEVYELIEEGDFRKCVEILDSLMAINPDYPGLTDCYRTSKFWLNREREIRSIPEGKNTADFLMKEWGVFDEYAGTNDMALSTAYRAVMRFIFFNAAEHYKTAFKKQEDTNNNFDLLLNLGDCFLRLEEYKNTIETLEYARGSYTSNGRLLSILGEAFYHLKDFPNSLLCFREAFFKNPSEIDLRIIKAKPVLDLIEIIRGEKNIQNDIREWIPVYGFITDTFYVRKNMDKHQVENIKKDIVKLDRIYQKMDYDLKANSNVIPRLLNMYLWLLDYYELQNYNKENLIEIKKRLMEIDGPRLEEYLKKKG